MKKSWTKIQLCALAAAALVAAGASAAPIVVTKGSNSGYLYFPGGASGGSNPQTEGGGSLDRLQTAPTVCMTASGVVPLPDGFTTGTIQAIVVAGGRGGASAGAGTVPGGNSSLTYGAVSIVASGQYDNGGRGAGLGGALGGGSYGGGGGGYGGAPGNGGAGNATGWADPKYYPGGDGGGAGPYSSPQGGSAGQGIPNGAPGGVMPTPTVPAAISCPTGSARGWGGGGNGNKGGQGGGSGRVATGVFRYTGGAITVAVGTGSAGALDPTYPGESGIGGVVALRFIAD